MLPCLDCRCVKYFETSPHYFYKKIILFQIFTLKINLCFITVLSLYTAHCNLIKRNDNRIKMAELEMIDLYGSHCLTLFYLYDQN